MMNQISIAVIGSCNIDVVVEAPKRPLAGETILGSRNARWQAKPF